MNPERPQDEREASPEGGPDAFERAATRKPRGLLGEYADYLWSERKWWLAPVIFFLLLASGFVVLGGSGLAPFIYALF